MEAAILAWLQDLAVRAFGISLVLFAGVNALFAAVVFVRRDRELVNRWTSRVLALNLVLVGTGIGVPVLAITSGFVVSAAAPFVRVWIPRPAPDADADEGHEVAATRLQR